MYYLRKEPEKINNYKQINKTVDSGSKILKDDRVIYKSRELFRFYRGRFNGLESRYYGMKVYTCRTLKYILELREVIFKATNELFDVYDENGKIELTN